MIMHGVNVGILCITYDHAWRVRPQSLPKLQNVPKPGQRAYNRLSFAKQLRPSTAMSIQTQTCTTASVVDKLAPQRI